MTETDGLTSRIDDNLNDDAWKSDEARRLTSESMFFYECRDEGKDH